MSFLVLVEQHHQTKKLHVFFFSFFLSKLMVEHHQLLNSKPESNIRQERRCACGDRQPQRGKQNKSGCVDWLMLDYAEWQVTDAPLRRCWSRPPCTLACKLAVFC